MKLFPLVQLLLYISESFILPTRQRLRPWLEAVINSGFVPGLVWLNDDQTKFRVPWVHSGKQDWTPESSQIFMVSRFLYLLMCDSHVTSIEFKNLRK